MVNEYIRKVKLIAVKEDQYTVYVFQDVENSDYIMCTRLPNWKVPDIELGTVGFLKYQIVNAGDEYITPEGERIYYRYANSYFINFISDLDVVKNNEITL